MMVPSWEWAYSELMSEVQASVQGSSAMIDQRSLPELCQIEEAPMEQEHYQVSQETWMTA